MMENLKNIYHSIIDFIKNLFSVSDQTAMYVLIGTIVLVILIIILVIVLITSAHKKTKKKKIAKQEVIENPNNNNELVKEKVIVEEVKQNDDASLNNNTKKDKNNNVKQEKVNSVDTDDKSINNKQEDIKELNEDEISETKTSRIAIGKYEVFPVNNVYLYRLKASNGEIMVVSEIYKTAKGAIGAIETVKKNIETGTLQIYEDKHGLWQFKLFASNKRLLVVSANYTSQVRCESAAESFKKFALISPVSILDSDPEQLMEEIKLEALADKKGGKIIVNEDKGIYDFKLYASNGVVLCSSIEYKTKTAITSAIVLMKDAINNGTFFVVKDKNGMYQFKLYSTQGRCVVIGEAYKNKTQAISAANSVSSFINLAEVNDTTTNEEEKTK